MPQPENPGQPPSQPPGQAKKDQQTYVVKVNFTDEKGKTWTAGSKFEGDENAVQQALRRQHIVAESPDAETKPV